HLAAAALHHGPLEEPLGCGRAEQLADAEAAGALAADRHPIRVAPEGGDVFAHPLQGGDLVQEAEAAGPGTVADIEEAEGAQAVVQGDDDHAAPGEGRSVIEPD